MTRLFAAIILTAIPSLAAAQADDWRPAATQFVLDDNPDTIVEAMFTTNRSFWVSVRDDGSRRDGFAEYVCLALKDGGRPADAATTVTIWDAYAMARGEMVEIGKARCP